MIQRLSASKAVHVRTPLLIDAKATCITRSDSTSMRSGHTGHRRGTELVARIIRLRFGSLDHASGSAINPQ